MASSRHVYVPRQAQAGDILLVVHEFVARSPDELSLSKGDRIELIERDDDFGDGWYLGRHLQNGNTGLFPEVYTTTAPRSIPTTAGSRSKGPSLRSTTSPITSRFAAGAAGDGAAKTPPATETPATSYFASNNNVSNNGPTSPGMSGPPVSSPVSESMYRSRSQPLPSDSIAGGPGSSFGKHPPLTSTVMNETLSVIDEHITNMNKPSRLEPGHLSIISERRPSSHDSGSHYSANASQTGLPLASSSDAEEEDPPALSEQEVSQWPPNRVAEYLESIGVEKSHCELFQTEEFTGEVLLQMDQSQIFMKELELGPIGRRMKTWQKIKALQEEVRAGKTVLSPRSSQANMSRTEKIQGQSGITPPLSGRSSPRPSGGSLRNIEHRRHSSTDQAASLRSSEPRVATRTKQSSFDRGWTLSEAATSSTAASKNNEPSRSISAGHLHTVSADRGPYSKGSRASSQISLPSHGDTDKGYGSGGEADARRAKNVLRKRDGAPTHDRGASYSSEKRRSSGFFWNRGRGDSPVAGSEGNEQMTVRHSDGVRIVSEPLQGTQTSPTVTRLEYGDTAKLTPDESKRASTASDKTSSLKTRGFRTISDAITGREKSLVTNADRTLLNEGSLTESPDRTSYSPSGATASYDLEDANKSEYSTPAVGLQTSGTKRKPKKATSAYVRGLEKKTPQEQMIGCDYSGWMKKKSSNLMTTWKPRFFVLRGRRLSYYYSETDTEEKGLIDISNHRVLPADHDFITNIHATLTGATTSSPTSPHAGAEPKTPLSTQSDDRGVGASLAPSTTAPAPAPVVAKGDSDPFLFKLMPPRSGLSKGVNFTRPAVHYFAVPSRQEGRLWMAALIKATIDRDDTMSVITTYQQKTITLEQARARKERPPFLMGSGEEGEQTGAEEQSETATTTTAATADTVAGSQEAPNGGTEATTIDSDDKVAESTGSEIGHETNTGEEQQEGGSGLGIQGLSEAGTRHDETAAV